MISPICRSSNHANILISILFEACEASSEVDRHNQVGDYQDHE